MYLGRYWSAYGPTELSTMTWTLPSLSPVSAVRFGMQTSFVRTSITKKIIQYHSTSPRLQFSIHPLTSLCHCLLSLPKKCLSSVYDGRGLRRLKTCCNRLFRILNLGPRSSNRSPSSEVLLPYVRPFPILNLVKVQEGVWNWSGNDNHSAPFVHHSNKTCPHVWRRLYWHPLTTAEPFHWTTSTASMSPPSTALSSEHDHLHCPPIPDCVAHFQKNAPTRQSPDALHILHPNEPQHHPECPHSVARTQSITSTGHEHDPHLGGALVGLHHLVRLHL